MMTVLSPAVPHVRVCCRVCCSASARMYQLAAALSSVLRSDVVMLLYSAAVVARDPSVEALDDDANLCFDIRLISSGHRGAPWDVADLNTVGLCEATGPSPILNTCVQVHLFV